MGDFSWVPNDAIVEQQSIETDEADDRNSDGQVEAKVEMDFDVADDTELWL